MINFEKVTKIYSPNSIALKDVSFAVNQGEFISILGRSGAGKTTLIKLFLAEERPTQGRILYNGYNIHQISRAQLPIFRRKIGSIFQDHKLLPLKTTYENIAYAMEVIGATDREIRRDVPEVIDIVGLTDKVCNFPAELSSGERQRVAIARALIHRPEVIIADEPTASLDPYNTKDIIHLLLKICELGTTVILATHNKEVINNLEKRVITIEDGRVIRDEKKGQFIL